VYASEDLDAAEGAAVSKMYCEMYKLPRLSEQARESVDEWLDVLETRDGPERACNDPRFNAVLDKKRIDALVGMQGHSSTCLTTKRHRLLQRLNNRCGFITTMTRHTADGEPGSGRRRVERNVRLPKSGHVVYALVDRCVALEPLAVSYYRELGTSHQRPRCACEERFPWLAE
jgi:hypothetical protein